MTTSRRSFLSYSGPVLGSAWLTLNTTAIAEAAKHAHAAAAAAASVATQGTAIKNFTPEQARDLGAISEQIIPTDETPGAREAGSVYFIEGALSGFFSAHRADFLADLQEFERDVAQYAASVRASGKRFADLPADQQTEILRSLEHSRFFGTTRFLTIAGYLAAPAYGGNRDRAGWKTVGFDDSHVFTPPFGYYDRDYPGFQPYPKMNESKKDGA